MPVGEVECNTLLNGSGAKASKVQIPAKHHDNGDVIKEQAFPFVLIMMTSWAALLVIYGMYTEFDESVLNGSESGAKMSYIFCESIPTFVKLWTLF